MRKLKIILYLFFFWFFKVIVEMVEEKISIQGAFIIQAMLNHSKLISPAFEIKNTGGF